MAECCTEMSEESDIEASDSEEIEIYNRINLKPYDMEPRRKCEHGEVDFMTPCLFHHFFLKTRGFFSIPICHYALFTFRELSSST